MVRSPFLSPRWLARHVLTVILVIVFLSLGWWQVRRAAAGNMLSYGYAVEWPVFAAFVVALWVKEVRAELHPPTAGDKPPEPARQPTAPGYVPFSASRATRPAGAGTGTGTEDSDPELAAYNDYLSWLAANPQRRPDEYPKGKP